jgi:hypothetical protein
MHEVFFMKFYGQTFMDEKMNFHGIKFIQNPWLLDGTYVTVMAFNIKPKVPLHIP